MRGNATNGRALKKSPEGGALDRLRRRGRPVRTPAPGSHLGTRRPDSGFGVQLQLAEAFLQRSPKLTHLYSARLTHLVRSGLVGFFFPGSRYGCSE